MYKHFSEIAVKKPAYEELIFFPISPCICLFAYAARKLEREMMHKSFYLCCSTKTKLCHVVKESLSFFHSKLEAEYS